MALVNFYDFNENSRRTYDLAITEGLKTRTGAEIMDYLALRDFDVVVLTNGAVFGQMLTERDQSGPEVLLAREEYKKAFGQQATVIARPTVFWCPDYQFEYYGDVVGCTVNSSGGMIPKKTVGELRQGEFYYRYFSNMMGRTNQFDVPVVRYTKGKMAPWMVLFHELGHVKQYYESGGDAGWTDRLRDTDEIEADNLARHENLICQQSNIAIRLHYKHMANGMGDINMAFMTEKKKPALRVSNSPIERIRMDGELLYAAKYNQLHNTKTNAEGYFTKT